MSDYTDSVEQVKAEFDDSDVELDDEVIAEQLGTLIDEYAVPESEAVKSVVNKMADKHDVDMGDGGSAPEGGSKSVNVEDIDTSGKWVTLDVQMVDEWSANHESINQTGLVGDPTGTIKFTAWADANKPELAEGESYRLQNVVTDSYQGQMSVQLQESSEVIELDEDIEAGEETSEETGVLVDVQSGSGLVKRCTADEDCSRVIDNGRCKEHGESEGEFDLRIKGVLDDGHSTQSVIFNREATEELTGVTLSEAQEIAQKELRTEAVIEQMVPDIVNRYYRIEGPKYGEYLMASEFEELGSPETDSVDEMLEAI